MKSTFTERDLELARRIQAAGKPIYIREDDPEASGSVSPDLLIYQQGDQMLNTASSYSGGVRFIVDIIITAQRAGLAISDFDLQLPWETHVILLEDPHELDHPYERYEFGGRDPLDFRREDVLNHRNDRRLLPNGSSVEGLLLGCATQPIPDRFQHGAVIPAFFILFDQFLHPHSWPIELRADRSYELMRRTRPRPAREPLFPHHSRSRNARVENDLVEVKKHP